MVDRVYFTVIFLLILGAGGYFVYDRIQALRENVQILKTNAEENNFWFDAGNLRISSLYELINVPLSSIIDTLKDLSSV